MIGPVQAGTCGEAAVLEAPDLDSATTHGGDFARAIPAQIAARERQNVALGGLRLVHSRDDQGDGREQRSQLRIERGRGKRVRLQLETGLFDSLPKSACANVHVAAHVQAVPVQRHRQIDQAARAAGRALGLRERQRSLRRAVAAAPSFAATSCASRSLIACWQRDALVTHRCSSDDQRRVRLSRKRLRKTTSAATDRGRLTIAARAFADGFAGSGSACAGLVESMASSAKKTRTRRDIDQR